MCKKMKADKRFFYLGLQLKLGWRNQARAHGCGRALGFLKLFYEKVCVYVCMNVYLFVFPHPREQTFYLKLESSLYTNSKD